MIKKIVASLALVAFLLASSLFGQTASSAKIVSVDGNKIQISITGDSPSWLKKGGVAKLSAADGKVAHASAKVTEGSGKTFTLTVKEKTDLKAGDTVSLNKGKVMSGC